MDMKKSASLLIFIFLLFGLFSCGSLKRQQVKNDAAFYKSYSKKMGYDLTGSENQRLLKECGEWIGTPYKYGGCTKKGTDCSCFVRNVFQEVYSLTIPRRTVDILNKCKKISKSKLKEGDLVFFKTGKKQYHVGIYLSKNHFIHASSSRGVVVSDLDNSYYVKHYYKSGRIK